MFLSSNFESLKRVRRIFSKPEVFSNLTMKTKSDPTAFGPPICDEASIEFISDDASEASYLAVKDLVQVVRDQEFSPSPIDPPEEIGTSGVKQYKVGAKLESSDETNESSARIFAETASTLEEEEDLRHGLDDSTPPGGEDYSVNNYHSDKKTKHFVPFCAPEGTVLSFSIIALVLVGAYIGSAIYSMSKSIDELYRKNNRISVQLQDTLGRMETLSGQLQSQISDKKILEGNIHYRIEVLSEQLEQMHYNQHQTLSAKFRSQRESFHQEIIDGMMRIEKDFESQLRALSHQLDQLSDVSRSEPYNPGIFVGKSLAQGANSTGNKASMIAAVKKSAKTKVSHLSTDSSFHLRGDMATVIAAATEAEHRRVQDALTSEQGRILNEANKQGGKDKSGRGHFERYRGRRAADNQKTTSDDSSQSRRRRTTKTRFDLRPEGSHGKQDLQEEYDGEEQPTCPGSYERNRGCANDDGGYDGVDKVIPVAASGRNRSWLSDTNTAPDSAPSIQQAIALNRMEDVGTGENTEEKIPKSALRDDRLRKNHSEDGNPHQNKSSMMMSGDNDENDYVEVPRSSEIALKRLQEMRNHRDTAISCSPPPVSSNPKHSKRNLVTTSNAHCQDGRKAYLSPDDVHAVSNRGRSNTRTKNGKKNTKNRNRNKSKNSERHYKRK